MDIFLFALYIISGIITLDAQIKQHPAGRQFLTGLENGTINVLRWRAEADVDNDLLGIRKILLISTGVLFAVTFIMSVNNVQPNIYFLFIFLINLLLFSSVQWFLDYKNETLKMVGFLLLMVASPWALHWLDESMGIQPSFTDAFRHDLSVFGDLPTSDYQLTKGDRTILSGQTRLNL